MRRASPPPSRKRRAPTARSSCWSATNITALTGKWGQHIMMRITEALEAFRPHRGDAIVVPGRGGRHWVEQTASPDLDVPLGDPAMGGHAGFGLGLALEIGR